MESGVFVWSAKETKMSICRGGALLCSQPARKKKVEGGVEPLPYRESEINGCRGGALLRPLLAIKK
ncbi:MAG: hypothetical protein IJB18_01650, partial [Clostridia bacterium]|nr:hypothetical protein [Clostridia bacterium]